MQLPDVFDHVPVALWWSDVTHLVSQLHALREEGVDDLRAWLLEHPPAVLDFASQIETLRVNATMLSLFGFQSEPDVISQGVGTVLTDQTLPTFVDNLMAIANDDPYFEAETVVRTLDGEILDVVLTISQFHVDHRRQCLVSLMNISRRTDAERKLRTLIDELEMRVEQRTAELHKEQQLLKDLLEVHERDRRLVAFEMHDGFVQLVASAIMHLGTVQEVRQAGIPSPCERAVQLLERSLREARHVISGLRPPVLDDEGLVAAVHYVIAEQFTGDEQVDFEFDIPSGRLVPILENNVFRIIQEALVNARRHSGARHIHVTVHEVESQLQIKIEDDGCGFDLQDVNKNGMGLRGIRERARLFGGHACFDTAPGQGTRIHVQLPLMG